MVSLCLAIAAGIFAVTTALCKLGDLVTSPRRKAEVGEWLTGTAVEIHDTKVPDLPRLMARIVLSGMERRLRITTVGWRFVVQSVILSALLTVLATLGGMALELWYFDVQAIASASYLQYSHIGQETLFHSLLRRVPFLPVFLTNPVFDFLTLAATFFILKFVATAPTWVRLCVILLDLAIAGVLLVACFGANGWIQDRTEALLVRHVHEYAPMDSDKAALVENALKRDGFSEHASVTAIRDFTYLQHVSKVVSHYDDAISKGLGSTVHEISIVAKQPDRTQEYRTHALVYTPFRSYLVAATTFLPTALYMLLLLVLLFLKAILHWSKDRAFDFLALMTRPINGETKPYAVLAHVSGLLTALFGTLAAGAKLCSL